MIKELIAIARAKFHFNVTCRLQERAARRRLEEYAQTLSPEKREWANNLRTKLDQATPGEAAGIFRKEAARLNEEHARVLEKIDAVEKRIAGALEKIDAIAKREKRSVTD